MKTRIQARAHRIGNGIALTALAGALALLAPAAHGEESPWVIELTAMRFEFAPNRITLKKGEPVVLRLKSKDVVHGLYLKPLGIDTEISPDKTTDVPVTPQVTGQFTAICHHFCGSGHGNMHLTVVVE